MPLGFIRGGLRLIVHLEPFGQGEWVEYAVVDVGVVDREVELACNPHPGAARWFGLGLQPCLRLLSRVEGGYGNGRLLASESGEVVFADWEGGQVAEVSLSTVRNGMVLVRNEDISPMRRLGVSNRSPG